MLNAKQERLQPFHVWRFAFIVPVQYSALNNMQFVISGLHLINDIVAFMDGFGAGLAKNKITQLLKKRWSRSDVAVYGCWKRQG